MKKASQVKGGPKRECERRNVKMIQVKREAKTFKGGERTDGDEARQKKR